MKPIIDIKKTGIDGSMKGRLIHNKIVHFNNRCKECGYYNGFHSIDCSQNNNKYCMCPSCKMDRLEKAMNKSIINYGTTQYYVQYLNDFDIFKYLGVDRADEKIKH